jgi:hypothetical protein
VWTKSPNSRVVGHPPTTFLETAALTRVIGSQTANGPRHNIHMPLTVFDCKGIPSTRRERIEAAVEAGGKHVAESYEGWIAADPFRGGVRVLITEPQGFERSVAFAIDEDSGVIAQQVRETIDE